MQRWTFLENKSGTNAAVEDETNSLESETVERVHIFRVKVLGALESFEVVALTGDLPGLGDWNLDDCVLLQPPVGDEYWHAEVILPSRTLIRYRYFICSVDDKKAIRAINTLTEIFTLEEDVEETKINIFERTCGERGWLLHDSAVQFRVDADAIELDKPRKNRLMRLHCSTIPIDESRRPEEPSVEVMEGGKFKQQQQFGVLIDCKEQRLFELKMPRPHEMVFLLNFYTFRSEVSQPCHYGYAWILPESITGVEGFIKSSIFCATKHQVLGSLVVAFVHVKPPLRHNFSMCAGFRRHWNMAKPHLDVGHFESLGTAMKTSEDGEVFREWTLESVNKAVGLDVQMLILNVQVTRDLVPVVFSSPFVMGTPIHQLAYHQLQTFGLKRPEDVPLDQLFIKLEQLLLECASSVAFVIQLSGPIANNSVDSVLEVVSQSANQRCIMFSSPLPSLCTLFQYKQNMYPVTLLLDHNTEPRAIEEWASAMQLLGFNVQNEAVFERIATEDLMIFCCWKEHHCISGSKRVALNRKVDKESDDGACVWTLTPAEGVELVKEAVEDTTESGDKHYVHFSLPRTSLSTATSCESVANLGL